MDSTNYTVSSHFMQEVATQISEFLRSTSRHEMSFPTNFTQAQKQFVSEYCDQQGLPKFFRRDTLVIRKSNDGEFTKAKNKHLTKHYSLPMDLRTTLMSRGRIQMSFGQIPFKKVHRNAFYKSSIFSTFDRKPYADFKIKAPIPPKATYCSLALTAENLPAWGLKNQIMDAISSSPISLISGETGSGKTTQVPKMILENATENKVPCRILCTQPRRISAVSVGNRVAEERGEETGQTVGYHIRHERLVSEKTCLTFCTIGILLKCMMNDDNYLNKLTHVIIDEVHERDRMCDFLLIVIKLNISRYPKLKVILMSANLDVDLYSHYFGECPVLEIPGRMFPVEVFYLEDIIRKYDLITDDMSKKMCIYRSKAVEDESSWNQWQPLSSNVTELDNQQDIEDGLRNLDLDQTKKVTTENLFDDEDDHDVIIEDCQMVTIEDRQLETSFDKFLSNSDGQLKLQGIFGNIGIEDTPDPVFESREVSLSNDAQKLKAPPLLDIFETTERLNTSMCSDKFEGNVSVGLQESERNAKPVGSNFSRGALGLCRLNEGSNLTVESQQYNNAVSDSFSIESTRCKSKQSNDSNFLENSRIGITHSCDSSATIPKTLKHNETSHYTVPESSPLDPKQIVFNNLKQLAMTRGAGANYSQDQNYSMPVFEGCPQNLKDNHQRPSVSLNSMPYLWEHGMPFGNSVPPFQYKNTMHPSAIHENLPQASTQTYTCANCQSTMTPVTVFSKAQVEIPVTPSDIDDAVSDCSEDIYLTPAASPGPASPREDTNPPVQTQLNFEEAVYRAAQALVSNGFYPTQNSYCPPQDLVVTPFILNSSSGNEIPGPEAISVDTGAHHSMTTLSEDIASLVSDGTFAEDNDDGIILTGNSVSTSILKDIDMSAVNSSTNDEGVKSLMCRLMFEAFETGFYQHFSAMITLIETNKIPPDFMHPENGATALMICAGRGYLRFVKTLLCKGASVGLKSHIGYTAYEWAQINQHYDVMEYLAHFSTMKIDDVSMEALSKEKDLKHDPNEDAYLLKAFYEEFSEDLTSFLMKILFAIHCNEEPGGILVFLPGFNEISIMKDRIEKDKAGFGQSPDFLLFTLHSCMPSREQQLVFKKIRPGTRKIILATNIAETSITIEDVIYVLDSGLFREKTYDAIADSSCLSVVKISQASATQRRGRAGRCQPGKAFHLFSRLEFNRMQPHQTPEILRTPLQDLCLQAKILASKDMAIVSFLSHAPQSPSIFAVANAVETLKRMDALDKNENVTELGRLLAELPLSPHLGKMVLYAVIFRCLDPVVTIASFLTQRDPFGVPDRYVRRHVLRNMKEKFADNTQSDHYALLHCYYSYKKAKETNRNYEWCKRSHISAGDMEGVCKTKKQILASLAYLEWIPRGNGHYQYYNSYSGCWPLIKGILVAGMYPNIIRATPTGYYTEKLERVDIDSRSAVFIGGHHPTYSMNLDGRRAEDPLSWAIYDELFMLDSSKPFVRNVTPVSPLAVFLFAGPLIRPKNDPPIDCKRFMVVRSDPSAQCQFVNGDSPGDGQLIEFDDGLLSFYRRHNEEARYLRKLIEFTILNAFTDPYSYEDNSLLIRTVADSLTCEDHCRRISTIPPSMEANIQYMDNFDEDSDFPPSSVPSN